MKNIKFSESENKRQSEDNIKYIVIFHGVEKSANC